MTVRPWHYVIIEKSVCPGDHTIIGSFYLKGFWIQDNLSIVHKTQTTKRDRNFSELATDSPLLPVCPARPLPCSAPTRRSRPASRRGRSWNARSPAPALGADDSEPSPQPPQSLPHCWGAATEPEGRTHCSLHTAMTGTEHGSVFPERSASPSLAKGGLLGEMQESRNQAKRSKLRLTSHSLSMIDHFV